MKSINAKAKTLKDVNGMIKVSLNGEPVEVVHADTIHGLGAGLRQGEVIVNGNAGDYLGALNAGATIRVAKNTGKYAADNMTAGTMIIEGDADFGAAQYCYGGAIVIHGNAGDFTATMNKGATIIIGGNVGHDAGTYMLSGDLIVLGDAGENFANYLIRGNVFIGGAWKSLGHNTRVEPLSDQDLIYLQSYFNEFHLNADPKQFKRIIAASTKPFYK
jgi:glutamate synthase domain-containing protein 3